MTLRVDPNLLRGFATQADSASTAIRDADVGKLVSDGADGVSGSKTQWMARHIGTHIASIEAAIADGVRGMGAAVRGAGDRFEVEDGELSTKFTDLF
ncbi:hypothetical protein KIH27_01340 [Mycobacterium sp. M1]|uniref:ESX-1 secretion-associated protein n=1 Tax=Mycolicibacter acidiphilus TaxID=2835306 RepID=A0ABS5RD64_9MYCO|nr:hypothetical protein [Mycolicibacter acidiphilus]MBS9532228.1 hypothetical protein [Mycolicibacter acidiphilus]